MPRITIQQFRAMLSARADGSAAVRAYREIARRPQLAAGIAARGWMEWPAAAGTEA